MKHLFLFLSIAAFFASCGTEAESNGSQTIPEDNFTISGTLSGIPNQTLYLQKIGRGNPIDVDSAIVDKNGKFELAGSTMIPDIFILKVNTSNLNLLIIDKDESVIVTGNGNSLNTFNVTGSQGSMNLIELNNALNSLQDKLDSLTIIRTEYMADEAKKHLLNSLNSEAQGLIDIHIKYLESFINDNSGSLSIIAALYQQIGKNRILTLEDNEDMFNYADSALMANYPTSVHVQNLHTGLENYKKQSQMSPGQNFGIGIGDMAPDISLPSPSGETYSLSSLRGKYVLLDFWAAWCSPCRRENPTLVANYNKYNAKGFEIFQVSLDKTKKAWTDAITKDNLNWPYHVSDLKYWESAPARLYNVQSIPSNFLIDPSGKLLQ